METQVYSEIGRLKQVLVHAPGREVEVIVPEAANDLLFEDILFAEKARSEHEILCRVLQKYGVEPFDILDLLQSALKASTLWERHQLLLDIQKAEYLPGPLIERLESYSPSELGEILIQGLLVDVEQMSDGQLYHLYPVPNLIFARDPVIVAFDRVLASSMAEIPRGRESLLMKFIFEHHPDWKSPQPLIDLKGLNKEGAKFTLEGGDFIVLNEETVAIAWSIRTSIESIRILALELKKLGVKNLIVAKLPPKISFIHLDTVFTRINHNECLIYPPLFAPESKERAQIFFFDLTKDEVQEREHPHLFTLLKSIGIDLNPIYCGGKKNLINQKREQWTHGANAFCIAPGVLLTYSRNIHTCNELDKAGYLCVNAQEVLSPSFAPNLTRKTAILLPGEELCRARGGPRCLTHPLYREMID